MNPQTDIWTLATIAGMTVVTVLTRAFFFLSSKPWTLPAWAQRGLHYAPIAALAAVIIPEMVMSQGHLIATWKDARLFAVVAGIAYFYWRKGVLGTIIAGMAIYLPLHMAWGW